MKSFLIALQFLTRIPVVTQAAPTPSALARSLLYYPLVGLILGLLLAAVNGLLEDTPALVRAALVLTAWVALTGGLHLDGLADSADAWAGAGGDRDRALAIMKDPRSGPIAVVALVLVLLMKLAALTDISSPQWLALAFIPALARSSIPLLFATTRYVRAGGSGEALGAVQSRTATVATAIATWGAAVLLLGARAFWLVLVLCALLLVLRAAMRRRLGGTTGDTAGALIEITETGLLLTLTLTSTDGAPLVQHGNAC